MYGQRAVCFLWITLTDPGHIDGGPHAELVRKGSDEERGDGRESSLQEGEAFSPIWKRSRLKLMKCLCTIHQVHAPTCNSVATKLKRLATPCTSIS